MKNSTSYYICDAVYRVRLLHETIITDWYSFESTFALLNSYAINLYRHYAMGYPASVIELQNWHFECIGKSKDEIFYLELSQDDIQIAVARQFGYLDWNQVINMDQAMSIPLEKAIDSMLCGDINQLKIYLQEYPDVIHQPSPFGHKAQIIHYLAANGVETHRQVSTFNASEILQLLLDKGANPNATHNIYGGNGSLNDLIKTSAHPNEAGIANNLLELLS